MKTIPVAMIIDDPYQHEKVDKEKTMEWFDSTFKIPTHLNQIFVFSSIHKNNEFSAKDVSDFCAAKTK
jgi:hypothetical protein